MRRLWVGMLLLVAAVGGCGGEYILTVPDQLARAEGEATAVVRLQRREFHVVAPPVEKAAVRFQIAEGPQRAAYTDDLGYAGAAVPVPAQPGRYEMTVAHLDLWGDEAVARGPVYVWPKDAAVVAVDLDCLPGLWLGDSENAARALKQLAAKARLLYLTRREAPDHAAAHRQLDKAGYPDGPILLWRSQRWHIVREGRYNMPRIVVESRLVSQLAEVRKTFPGLAMGVGDSPLAAKAFAEAGLKCILIGGPQIQAATDVIHRKSWQDLADHLP